MRPLLAVLAAALLAGCAGPAVGAGETSGVRETTGARGVGAIALEGECLGPAGVTVAHPADWAVNLGDVVAPCSRFAPEPFEVRPHSDVRMAAIALRVEDGVLDELAGPPPDEVARTDVLVDGRPAVRQVLVTGPGLYPEGTHITRYLIDLGQERTLVADAVLAPGDPDRETVAVLDAMMGALEIGGRVAR